MFLIFFFSTTSQAIEIGQLMQAKHIILNHFSQRYAKIPVFSQTGPDNVGIAFDNMTVTMRDLPLLPLFIPALKALFAEDHELNELRTEKKIRKKQQDKQKRKKLEAEGNSKIRKIATDSIS